MALIELRFCSINVGSFWYAVNTVFFFLVILYTPVQYSLLVLFETSSSSLKDKVFMLGSVYFISSWIIRRKPRWCWSSGLASEEHHLLQPRRTGVCTEGTPATLLTSFSVVYTVAVGNRVHTNTRLWYKKIPLSLISCLLRQRKKLL